MGYQEVVESLQILKLEHKLHTNAKSYVKACNNELAKRFKS